jgi:hypothetical protein
MCLQVPEDLTPLLFQLLGCVLVNQRELMKLIDPQCQQTKEMRTLNDNVFAVLAPVLQKLQPTSSTRREADAVSLPVVDVKFEPSPQPRDSSSYTCVDITGPAVSSEGDDETAPANVNREKTARATRADKKLSANTQNTIPPGWCGNFERNVAAVKEEQKSRRNILLIRGVLEDPVPPGDETQLAKSLLSPCAHLAQVTGAYRIGNQRNILRVELDQPAAQPVVDFFWANRDCFPSSTMSLAPSRVPALQLAVRRLHSLQKILNDRLPQLNARIVKGRGLLLRGTNYFTTFASVAPGLVLSNGDAIPSSLLLDNPNHPVVLQKNDPLSHSYCKAVDYFAEID